MGAMQNNASPVKQSKKRRGSVDNQARLDVFAKQQKMTGADWGGCDPKHLQAVVVAITELGGAITFGLSRDLGAHSLTLMLDGTRKTMWFNGNADLDEELMNVAATLGTLT